MWIQPLGQKDPLEESMATHCSILAWRIPWTEEPGGLQSTSPGGPSSPLGFSKVKDTIGVSICLSLTYFT